MKTNKTITKFAIIFLILLIFSSFYINGLIKENKILKFEYMVLEHENKIIERRNESLRVEYDIVHRWWQEAKELQDENTYKLTTEEREIVERVVAAEARGETLKGQMAVANVIKDRAELWNMTPEEVVTAKGQFAEPFQGEISEDIKLAVEIVFDKGIRVFKDHVTHFASNNPYWAENKTVRGTIGVHTFYY